MRYLITRLSPNGSGLVYLRGITDNGPLWTQHRHMAQKFDTKEEAQRVANEVHQPNGLVEIGKPLTFKAVRDQLRPLGITITKTGFDDYRVAFRGKGNEASAYYGDKLDDALSTGVAMAAHRRQHEV